MLAQVFGADELQFVLRRLNATLRHALASKPRRDGGGADNMMIAMSAGGMAFMAGRGAMAGASALGAGALDRRRAADPGRRARAGPGRRRRSSCTGGGCRPTGSRPGSGCARCSAEARAALSDEIMHRFTDLQYALTLALDDAIERRLRELDAHIAEIDKALAEDKAERTPAAGRAAGRAGRRCGPGSSRSTRCWCAPARWPRPTTTDEQE